MNKSIALRLKASFPLLLLCVTLLHIPRSSLCQPLVTVAHVDLDKYAGKWYEIASFPRRFQKGCYCTSAEYTPTDQGFLIVENFCNKDSSAGKSSYVKGKATVVPNSGNAKLDIQFFWPFKGQYWIIELADDYSYAVVGHPNRNYLWILSRRPTMDAALYPQLLAKIEAHGFDIDKIKLTTQ
jgi:apolipoprotein D and lipocalin family protein